MRTAVVGASGYAGGELLRLLDAHPTLEIATVIAGANAGRPLGEVHPSLSARGSRRCGDTSAAELAEAELVFLALPHGASAAVIDSLSADAIVIDLGADFRLSDPGAWQRWYSGEHAGTWPYGLPELTGARAALAGMQRVANPGCYATAVALGLAPLLDARLVEPDDIVVVAASGTTGAGRAPARQPPRQRGHGRRHGLQGRRRAPTPRRDAPDAEGASPEAAVSMSFTPLLVPMPRGILATCTATVRPGVGRPSCERRSTVMRRAVRHACCPRASHRTPQRPSARTARTCRSALDADSGRAIVVAAIDNLGKGAAGQAVQNANLMLGLAETTGLSVNGVGQ